MSQQKGKEVALRQRSLQIREFLQSDNVKQQVAYALPKYLNADRFIRIAFTAVNKNPDLLECTTESLASAIVQAAILGLELSLGRAHLVPFKNRKKNVKEVVFMPGYQGLVDLIRRTGEVSDVWAEVIREADKWEVTYGLDRNIYHKPDFEADDRGNPVGAYAVIKYKDGTLGWMFMHIKEVYEKHRNRSQAFKYAESSGSKDSPWHTDEDDMIKKTVLKKHSKLAPMSIEVQAAAAMDDAVEIGGSPAIAFQDLLTAKGKEMAIDPEVIDLETEEEPEEEETKGTKPEALPKEDPLETFLELSKQIEPRDRLEEFVKVCAEAYNRTADQIRKDAVKNWPDFTKTYFLWLKEKAQEEKKEKTKSEDAGEETLFDQFNRLNANAVRNFWANRQDELEATDLETKDAWNMKINGLSSLDPDEKKQMTLLLKDGKPGEKEEKPPETKMPTIVACFECSKSMNIEEAHKVKRGDSEYFACDEHSDKPPEPAQEEAQDPKEVAYWKNVGEDLEKWRVEMVRVDMEDTFYQILGNHGGTTIQEIVSLGDKKAVQAIFHEIGNARYPKP